MSNKTLDTTNWTDKDWFEQSFYNWLLKHGVEPIVPKENMFDSSLPAILNVDVTMHELRGAIRDLIAQQTRDARIEELERIHPGYYYVMVDGNKDVFSFENLPDRIASLKKERDL